MDDGATPRTSRPGKPPRQGLRIVIVLLVLAALGGAIWLAVAMSHRSEGAGGPGGRGGRRPSTTVGVATAVKADVPVTLDALGTVTPAATVTVVPQVSGVITDVLFREGQMVRKGQPLVIIDQRPLKMALLQAQGALTRDQAQLANARVLLQRDQTLLAQDSIARQDVDTQAALVRQLEGTVTTDRAAVGTAQLNLGFSRVTAPVSGRVGLRVVDVGNFISAGATGGVVVLTQVAPIDVAFTVPQDEVPRIQAQAAQGTLPVTAFDRTKTLTLDQGTFSTLDNQVDATTGTVKAKARFPNSQGKLFPQQFVNVRLNLQTLKDTVVVPVTAVRTGAQGDFVWILNTDHTVALRKVVRGPGTAIQVSIAQGLAAGERVVTEGGDRLTDGAKVTLPGDKPGQGGAGGGRKHRRGQGAGAAAGAAAAEQAAPAQGGAQTGAPAAGQRRHRQGQGGGQGGEAPAPGA